MSDNHIFLLPKADYYQWVAASREYVLRFKLNITPDIDSAGRFNYPGQLITYIDGAGADRDIAAYLTAKYPLAKLDRLGAASPVALAPLLAVRIASGDRLGAAAAALRLVWPTDYNVVTQPFGVNADIYRRFGLPGHEGIDIRAPMNANIYACADGTVSRVNDGSGNHAYGIHVRINHRDGYQTIYAHLTQALVTAGQVVVAGERIGLGDSTGNSSGSHLHLTLKKAGATAAGLTAYPNDIIDPAPFLVVPAAGAIKPAQAAKFDWPLNRCLVGLHSRADGPVQPPDLEVIKAARIEAVKFLSSAQPADVDQVRALRPDAFFMVRMFAGFNNRVVTPADFCSWMEYELKPFYERGVRYFEVHNEPNLQIEGWGYTWQDGRQFAAWFLEVMRRMRQLYPAAKFGFPGLSPGHNIPGQRLELALFLDQADEAARAADWVGCHCYWQDEASLRQPVGGLGYEDYRRRFPDKLLFITEFSNTSPTVDAQSKGAQYVEFYRRLRVAPGIGAAFAFVVSASANFPHEVWRAEDGRATAVPALVGKRGF